MKNTKKYKPFYPVQMKKRFWPDNVLKEPPVWCSVDLRDGNQALIEPMHIDEKIRMFQMLCGIGIKEIEVGFPSSNQTEYDTLRTLIDDGHIPDDVTVQVLVQSREHLIRRTFDAIRGAKNVILHFYNSTGPLERKVVFGTDMDGVIKIAVDGAKLINRLSEEAEKNGTNIRYEYSPEFFSDTEIDNSVKICSAVCHALGASEKKKIIVNLPATVEGSMPNCFADQIEYFSTHLDCRDSVIISVHPHNDRGTAVATTELALLAGAQRVEGTLFGNGERTGNVDIVTLALNMYTQGIDPKLDFSNINRVREIYEDVTGMRVHERHPYAGSLVFTAFSGSHQDAINKGIEHMKNDNVQQWEVPYLPLDPADVGRQYEPIIRINNQSGKGGAAFILSNSYGYHLPKAMHPEFGALVKEAADKKGNELSGNEILDLFTREYIEVKSPYRLAGHRFQEEYTMYGGSTVHLKGTLLKNGGEIKINGSGNGPIDAFFNAVSGTGLTGYKFVSYHEHAISEGSDSKAIAYIELLTPAKKTIFGVGISHNINLASIRGVICAVNRSIKEKI